MKKGLFVLVALAVLMMPFALAATSTTVTIKAEPFHDLFVQVANPTGKAVIGTETGSTDINGELTFDFSSNLNLDELTFFVVTRLFGEVVSEDWVEEVPVETEMIVWVIDESELPTPPPAEDNETAEEETEEPAGEGNETIEEEAVEEETTEVTEEPVEEESSDLTGAVITEGGEGLSLGNVYYIIGAVGLLVIVIILFMIARVKQTFPLKKKDKTSPDTKNGAARTAAAPRSQQAIEAELADAERKIKEAQQEINRLKQKDSQISQAEEEFRRAKEKLDRLKSNAVMSDDDKRYDRFQNRR